MAAAINTILFNFLAGVVATSYATNSADIQ
jgi:hypothetical protein